MQMIVVIGSFFGIIIKILYRIANVVQIDLEITINFPWLDRLPRKEDSLDWRKKSFAF